MELLSQHMSTGTILGFSTLLLLFSCYIFFWRRSNPSPLQTPPEAKGKLPLIGHLHLLGRSGTPLHLSLGAMADQHGPIFTVWLGNRRTVVVSGSEIAKECFTIQDQAISSRPNLIASEHIGYNYAMFGIAPYGPYWREMRKLAIRELLSNQKLQQLKHMRAYEVERFVKELHKLWMLKKDESQSGRVLVDIKQWFCDVSFRIVVRMIGVRPVEEMEDIRQSEEVFRGLLAVFGKLVVGDYLPFLRWLDLGGHEKCMKKTMEGVDSIVQRWIDEHKLRSLRSSDEKKDFIDMLSSAVDGRNLEEHHPDVVKKSTLVDIVASTETIPAALTWAVSLLLKNPSVLKKAQDELQKHIGKNRQVNESDIPKLIYLQAIVKETLRIYPAAPLTAPHLVTRDCTIGSYHVPAGSTLMINLYKIQRDPLVWKDPHLFKPERFYISNEDVEALRRQKFEYIPFGAGRRKCPGASLGLQVLYLTLASLLNGFELSSTHIDMTEAAGLANLKETPLSILIAPQLPRNVYE